MIKIYFTTDYIRDREVMQVCPFDGSDKPLYEKVRVGSRVCIDCKHCFGCDYDDAHFSRNFIAIPNGKLDELGTCAPICADNWVKCDRCYKRDRVPLPIRLRKIWWRMLGKRLLWWRIDLVDKIIMLKIKLREKRK